jgi:phosphomethylpyrimidine synthase
MPLGPIVSDSDPDLDHVASAIGAAALMLRSRGGIINAISRIEHRGGVPSLSLSLEALRVARLAAQVASLTFDRASRGVEEGVARKRASAQSCVVGSEVPGCSRCSALCPLISSSYSAGGSHGSQLK